MNRFETIAAVILSGVFVTFLLKGIGLHAIPDAAVCLAAIFVFFLSGVLEPKDFNTGVNWDLVIFIGMAISLGSIFTETGISDWLSGIIVPALSPVAGNPLVFMFAVMAAMFLWRFVDVAIFIPTMAIIIPILPDLQQQFDIHPMVFVAVLVMAHNAFFMSYQNIWAMMSKSVSGERAWSNKHLGLYGTLYFAAVMVTLFAAVPLWGRLGLF